MIQRNKALLIVLNAFFISSALVSYKSAAFSPFCLRSIRVVFINFISKNIKFPVERKDANHDKESITFKDL